MSFTHWLRKLQSICPFGSTSRVSRRAARSRPAKRFRLQLECLEDRCLPSTYTVTNLLDSGTDSLRAAITAANANPGADTIDIGVTGTIGLTSGQLDIIDSVTINGPGADALTVSGNHASRVFGIAGDPTVTIANLTVADGSTTDSPAGGVSISPGGGVFMAGGTVNLDHVTVSGNSAVGAYGGLGGAGAGGGLYVAGGTLTLDQCTVSGNYAIGGQGGWEDFEYEGYYYSMGYDGGHGMGGGVYVAGGTVYVNQSTIAGNHAWGGAGGRGQYEPFGGIGGDGAGGGILVYAGALEIHQSSIFDNEAFGGWAGSYNGGYDGRGAGGGLDIQPNDPPRVVLDIYTESNTINNIADINPNISGPYSLNGVSPPRVAIGDVTALEGNTGTTAFVFTVNLSAPTNQAVSVNYTTADGSAAAGSDYQAVSGTLTIPAGQTTGTITVLVNGDRLAEPNETFVVNLSSPVNATIADGQGAGTILDDEPRISISDVSKKEGNGNGNSTTVFTFTVTLSVAYDVPVTLNFATADGTAKTSDNDYVANSGTITFAPGETTKTITVVVKGDKKKEANENFFVDLSDLSSYTVFLDSRGTGTILNDD